MDQKTSYLKAEVTNNIVIEYYHFPYYMQASYLQDWKIIIVNATASSIFQIKN